MKNNYIYCDLKLENMILKPISDSQTELKFIDLSSMEKISHNTKCRNISLIYTPPDYNEDDINPNKIDIWCLGILIFEIIFGISLFHKDNFTNKTGKPYLNIDRDSDIDTSTPPSFFSDLNLDSQDNMDDSYEFIRKIESFMNKSFSDKKAILDDFISNRNYPSDKDELTSLLATLLSKNQDRPDIEVILGDHWDNKPADIPSNWKKWIMDNILSDNPDNLSINPRFR